VYWALRELGVDEWIVSVIKAMYEDQDSGQDKWQSGGFKFFARRWVYLRISAQSFDIHHCTGGLV